MHRNSQWENLISSTLTMFEYYLFIYFFVFLCVAQRINNEYFVAAVSKRLNIAHIHIVLLAHKYCTQ